jgi:hypothetical protein
VHQRVGARGPASVDDVVIVASDLPRAARGPLQRQTIEIEGWWRMIALFNDEPKPEYVVRNTTRGSGPERARKSRALIGSDTGRISSMSQCKCPDEVGIMERVGPIVFSLPCRVRIPSARKNA